MKKGFVLLFSFAAVLGFSMNAQVDPAQQEKQQQQQQLLNEVQQQEQQKLQDELLKQQQKEAEELLRQQQKQREKEEQALQKQQEKEQKQLQKQQEKEQRAAEKAQARKEKRDSWGRGSRISIDPSIGIGNSSRIFNSNSLLNARNLNATATVEFHYPIAKSVDLNIGVGYRINFFSYTNLPNLDDQGNIAPQTYGSRNYYDKEALTTQHIIQVPIKLSFVSQKHSTEWFVGVVPGYSIGGKFTYYSFNSSGNSTKFNTDDLWFMNRFRCDLVFGEQGKMLIFSPGVQFYINLMPTYIEGVEEVGRIHEWGFRFTL